MSPSAGGNTAPRFSIVIARASTEETVLDVLSAVRRQETSDSYEIILADRNDDDVTRRVAAGHPEVIVVRAAPATCLPELRTMAMRRGQGQLVVVTGDYCVPEPDWLQSFSRAFEEAPDGVIAAGGCVLDGRPRTLADQAAFYLEYSTLLPPIPEGLVAQLPGMNVCYKRAALDGISDDVLARGFWEHTLHPRLQQTGHRFWSSEQIRIRNVRAYPWAASTRQRFLYSKHFAGT
ncbi:MAG: glycosyltransferase family 2 protein, partial [Planctomycetota bacterium]